MMDIFSNINWPVVVENIFSGLITTLVTAVVGLLFAKHYFSKLNFSEKMQSYGFKNTSTNKQSQREIKDMCKDAKRIKIINVSGFHYLNANEKYLKEALQRKVEIQFLCANPNSIFLTDIEKMENNTFDANGKQMRSENSHIKDEIENLIRKYRDLGLQIRFYSTEYRMPYVLSYYNDNTVKAWLTMSLPPYKSTKAFVLRGERTKDMIYYNDELNFVEMMETNFDTIWNTNSKSLEEIDNG